MAVTINSAWDAKLYRQQKEKARKSINSAWDAQKYYETYGGNGQSGNWNSPLRNVGAYGYTYNPKTHSWEKSYCNTSAVKIQTSYSSPSLSNIGGSGGGGSSGGSGGSSSSSALSQTGVVNSNNSATSDSKTSAEKEYIEVEFNTLTGECEIVPNSKSLRLKVGDTVTLKGVGKYLSGLYFISEIKKSISTSDGLKISLVLIKNGFGDSLKKAAPIVATTPARSNEADVSKLVVNNSIKVGDKVKIVGSDAVYSNAHDGVKVPEWVKQQELTVDALSDDGKRARLLPIWSWTYIKYLKHV